MRVVIRLLSLVLAVLLTGQVAHAGSETPPQGPPWQRDFVAAQKEALESGKPLFLYFTKTY